MQVTNKVHYLNSETGSLIIMYRFRLKKNWFHNVDKKTSLFLLKRSKERCNVV